MEPDTRSVLGDAERAGLGDRDLAAVLDFVRDRAVQRKRRRVVEKFDPASVPAPAGPFSHVARHGDTLYVSGQVALDAAGNVVGEGDIVRQSEVVFGYLEAILQDQGVTFDDVVNVRTFLTSMEDRAGYGSVRAKYFTGVPPTSTTVAVSELFRPGLLIEVELVAALR